jgi:hypothetical protein
MNLNRRHLSPSQRAMIAADLATTKHGGARRKAQNCALTHAQAAEHFSVSERQVDKAAAVLKAETGGHAATELVEQIRSGEMSLSRAEKLLHIPLGQKRQFVAQNDRKTTARPKTRELSHYWARQFDEVILQTERLCARTAGLIARAEEANELTPERRERLAAAWRNAPCAPFVESEPQEEIAAPAYRMPFDEA